VFYSYSPASKVEYDALFGQSKRTMPEYSVIPYYYFGNFEDTKDISDKLMREQNMRYKMLRHVIFLHKHLVILDSNDYNNWNEEYYDSAVILEDEIVNDNDNRQMILAVKDRTHFVTIAYS
jgi:hypothetical protein